MQNFIIKVPIDKPDFVSLLGELVSVQLFYIATSMD